MISMFEVCDLILDACQIQIVSSAREPDPSLLWLWKGLPFYWSLRAPCLTYPLPIHNLSSPIKPGYTLLSIDSAGLFIHIWPLACTGNSPDQFPSCLACRDQPFKVCIRIIEDSTWILPQNLKFTILSHKQSWGCLEYAVKHWIIDRCKVCNKFQLINVVLQLVHEQLLNAMKVLSQSQKCKNE